MGRQSHVMLCLPHPPLDGIQLFSSLSQGEMGSEGRRRYVQLYPMANIFCGHCLLTHRIVPITFPPHKYESQRVVLTHMTAIFPCIEFFPKAGVAV